MKTNPTTGANAMTDKNEKYRELLPCPFCGGSAQYNFATKKSHDGTFWYWVECSNCQQCGKQSKGSKEQESEIRWARKAWNTRASRPAPSSADVERVADDWLRSLQNSHVPAQRIVADLIKKEPFIVAYLPHLATAAIAAMTQTTDKGE